MTESNNVMYFRKKFIEFLIDKGHSVVVVAHDKKREDDIRALGAEFYNIDQNNRSLNPLSIFKYKKSLKRIVKKEKPDVVCTFQLKPNVFGIPIAKKMGCANVVGMVEGLGDVYINNSLKWKCIRFIINRLYKNAFKKANKVFFLNNDDKNEFICRKLIKEDKCILVRGIGVDLNHFEFKPLKNHDRFLMVARMLKTKGIFEYCKCARLVKQKYPSAQFDYLGQESSVRIEDIKEYIDDNSINYLGTTSDVRPFIEDATVVMLPSYREGVPMSVMEAEAVGRAIITSDAVGCKEAVVDGYNGFLVSVGDYMAMADKAIWCIENKEQVPKMCANARTYAEDNFDCNVINQKIYEVANESIALTIDK